jgi:CheY-like chemotaxis protein
MIGGNSMFSNALHVLVVDDDPDVLAVTKLVMRTFTVFGVPIVVHTASSKAEAIKLLQTTLATPIPGQSLAWLMIVDVVMETDQAGLELCQYVREELNNQMMQIYVRTGQPGVAPERRVLERYDINGYFSKVEATEDKLYAIIKAGTRQAFFTDYVLGVIDNIHALITLPRSRPAIIAKLEEAMAALKYNAQGNRMGQYSFKMCYVADGKVIAGAWGGSEGEALERVAALRKLPGMSMGGDDRSWIDGNDFLIEIAESPTTAQMAILATDTTKRVKKRAPSGIPATSGGFLSADISPPMEFDLLLQYRQLRSVAALWKQSE